VRFKEPSADPLIDLQSDHCLHCVDSVFFSLEICCLLDGLEEEVLEGLQGVLVHVIDDA
jgi:hypothetical protein